MESVKIENGESKALRANKLTLVERLADDLAHEIKNPLHSMVINLEVLKRRISRGPGSDPAELLHFVEIVSGELDRVSRRVDLLLRMVRPDRAGEPVTLAEAVEDLLDVVELERERQGVTIELRAAQTASRVRLPRDTARHFVLNLLLIALDSAGPGGRVLISHASSDDADALLLESCGAASADRAESDGVEEGPAMRAMAHSLAETLGASLEMDSVEHGDGAATRLNVQLPFTEK